VGLGIPAAPSGCRAVTIALVPGALRAG